MRSARTSISPIEGASSAPEAIPRETEKLSPRQRQTLRLLLLGHSEKQVAAELGLAQGTVHAYVKQLHAHFCVNSRGELLALIYRRLLRQEMPVTASQRLREKAGREGAAQGGTPLGRTPARPRNLIRR